MSCIEFGLNLSPKIAAHIDDVAQGDFKKARIMAMFLDNNQEFIDYVKKDDVANKEYEQKGIEGINGNTLKRLLRNFYNIKFLFFINIDCNLCNLRLKHVNHFN